jgi:hypothetical protein
MHLNEVVPEAILNDFDALEWMGYSESNLKESLSPKAEDKSSS